MSVIHFGPDDLAKVAGCAVGETSSAAGKAKMQRTLQQMVVYSAANALAYNATYGDKATGWDCETILAYVRYRDHTDAVKEAVNTAHLLRYNLVSNNGQDFATVEALDAILSVVTGIARKHAANYLYPKTKAA